VQRLRILLDSLRGMPILHHDFGPERQQRAAFRGSMARRREEEPVGGAVRRMAIAAAAVVVVGGSHGGFFGLSPLAPSPPFLLA
jgi:hypothetical protein